jgi:LAS superfamily LD-carboxypeptidase LdcB
MDPVTFTKRFVGLSLVALLLLGGGGAYAVYDHGVQSRALLSARLELASTTQTLAETVSSSSAAITALQASTTELERAIARERAQKESVTGELTSTKNKVTTLTKLTQTDPQLLAKYSKIYFLNENYSPARLGDITPALILPSGKSLQFQSDALPFLQNLLDAAKQDGVYIFINSAYRSFAQQKNLKSNYAVRYGKTAANSFSADQGYSEHQLGTTADFTVPELNGSLPGFDRTPAFQWLLTHAHLYGFILSYPASNAFYIYEPWHWRFVGVELATYLHEHQQHFYDLDQRSINTYLVNLFDR